MANVRVGDRATTGNGRSLREAECPTGLDVLLNPALNKSTAFTEEERQRYKLRGLLPPAVCSQEAQLSRALENLRRQTTDIERYISLQALLSRNERLFYRLVVDCVDEILPLIYTPTVGQACQEFAHIFRQTRGLYVTAQDRGHVREIFQNWPHRGVRVIVVTDGERILGLGDLGANGMGIPIGKLSLYTALAGIHPEATLPIMLDVGSNNAELRDDPLYIGLRMSRIGAHDYFELVDELISALQDTYPDALLQFEDFATPNAYALLSRYRRRLLCFNDDIQGTAAMALAGVYGSSQVSRVAFRDMRVMFLGAGSAATGIADLMVKERAAELLPHSLPYAHDHPRTDLLNAIDSVRPNVLIGATGAAGSFTQAAIERMARFNDRPAIFALSNPTSRAECTAEGAYRWSSGRAIFASGSPFEPVNLGGRTFHPGQSNNAYIFPGIGLGATFCRAMIITDAMFLVAAKSLAAAVSRDEIERGTVYPPLQDVRAISVSIAAAVAQVAYDARLAGTPKPHNLEQAIQQSMYDPRY